MENYELEAIVALPDQLFKVLVFQLIIGFLIIEQHLPRISSDLRTQGGYLF